MPTASVNCSQHVMDQLAELNMKALQVQKGQVRTVALRAVQRRQRSARIKHLKTKISQIVEIDISGDSPPKDKPSQKEKPVDNPSQQPPEKNTAKSVDKASDKKTKKPPEVSCCNKGREQSPTRRQTETEKKAVKMDKTENRNIPEPEERTRFET